MMTNPRLLTVVAGLLIALAASGPSLAQKYGGILRLSHFDSPASMSILEEATRATVQPMMGVFNNLVLYDQHIAQSSLEKFSKSASRLAAGGRWTRTSRTRALVNRVIPLCAARLLTTSRRATRVALGRYDPHERRYGST